MKHLFLLGILFNTLTLASAQEGTEAILIGNPAYYSDSVTHPKVIHISTHGLFIADSSKALSGHSGLQDSAQTGVLTAYDAMKLNLDSTSLVVLSACNTSLGDKKAGEGIYGLERDITKDSIESQKAMNQSMLSFSGCDDREHMSHFISAFYTSWQSGHSKLEAFEHAKKQLFEKYPDTELMPHLTTAASIDDKK